MFKIFFKLIISLSFLFLATSATALVHSYDEMPTSFKDKWEKLLHYKNKQSLLYSHDFFLSSNGTVSPQNELLATINFFEKDPLNKCLFPARNYLINGEEPSSKCTDFQEFKKYVSTDVVRVVFADESVNSPISSMGHVFLVLEGINANGIYKKHATSFVADTSVTKNLLVGFIFDEITGTYTLEPYDDTIYRYVSEEKRTLWEYELNLSDEEKKWLFYHLYELKSHKFKYNFFDNNCASGTESLLAIANSGFEKENHNFYITPIEYVKYLASSNRVIEHSVRPSSEDDYRLKHKVTVDPLLSGETSRVSLMVNINKSYRPEYKFKYLPLSSDYTEDTLGKSKLSEFKLLEFIAKHANDYTSIEEITLINMRSLPNFLINKKPKFNFGIKFHGDVDNQKTVLNPDLNLGIGYSFYEKGFRPFIAVDSGLYMTRARASLYLSSNIGVTYSHKLLGKFFFNLKKIHALKNDYRNLNSQISLTYSKRFSEQFWINSEINKTIVNSSKDMEYVSIGIDYRF